MVKVDASQPITRREVDYLTVALRLAGVPDELWQSIFNVKARLPDSPLGCELRDLGEGEIAASIAVPWTVSDDEARSRVQELVRFVDAVEHEHVERLAAFSRLEDAIGSTENSA